jgi:hypothetical protein
VQASVGSRGGARRRRRRGHWAREGGGQAQAACADACGSEKGGPVDEYEMLDVNPTVEK